MIKVFNKLFIEIIFISVLFNSCCNKHDENSGLIISSFDFDSIPDWRIKDCYNLPNTFCIRNDSTYRKVFALSSNTSQCHLAYLPTVDFTKVSILIFKKDMPGPTNFFRNVGIDSNLKIIRYSIKTKRYFCPDASSTFSYNMVIVPKIGMDYKIEYQ